MNVLISIMQMMRHIAKAAMQHVMVVQKQVQRIVMFVLLVITITQGYVKIGAPMSITQMILPYTVQNVLAIVSNALMELPAIIVTLVIILISIVNVVLALMDITQMITIVQNATLYAKHAMVVLMGIILMFLGILLLMIVILAELL